MNEQPKCECVSFPRSGHHLFQRLMQMNCPELIYCEQYNHCKSVPCPDPKTNFQKSHDFNLKDPQLNDYLYIIQFRNPYESVCSWYDLSVKSKSITEDNEEQWKLFLKEKIRFWIGFMQKWTVDRPAQYGKDRFLNVEYSSLIKDTESVIGQALEFIGYPKSPHQLRTRDDSTAFNEFGRMIDTVPRRRRNDEDFRYYNPLDIEFVQEACAAHWNLVAAQ